MGFYDDKCVLTAIAALASLDGYYFSSDMSVRSLRFSFMADLPWHDYVESLLLCTSVVVGVDFPVSKSRIKRVFPISAQHISNKD